MSDTVTRRHCRGDHRMIVTFEDITDEDAHDHFQRWRNANQDGFFLNQKSPEVGRVLAFRCAVACVYA